MAPPMKPAASRILIVNGHSQANAGDQAIILMPLQLLKKVFPGARVTITSRTVKADRPKLTEHGAEVIEPIFAAPSGTRGRWRSWLKTLFSLVFPRQALIFLSRLLHADLVLACGGGYFYSNRRVPGLTFWQNYLHLRLAVLLRKRVVFFPQSFGPLANSLSRRLLAGLLVTKSVRAVFVREKISLTLLRDLLPAGVDDQKLLYCPDMAFGFSPEPEQFPPGAEFSTMPAPRLALALRDWDFPSQKTRLAKMRARDAYLEEILVSCRALYQEKGASFFLFSQAQGPSLSEDDRRIAAQVHDRLLASIPRSHLRSFDTPVGAAPAVFIDLLRQADLLITSRMHAAIFAFLAGIPAVVIGYQHKSLGILRALDLEACWLPMKNCPRKASCPSAKPY